MESSIAKSVRQQAEAAVGARFTVEGTGGGCEVLSTVLEGGLVVVLCDDNLSVDFGAYGPDYGVQVGVYTSEAWHNGGDAIGEAYVLDFATVGASVRVAVKAAAVTLAGGAL